MKTNAALLFFGYRAGSTVMRASLGAGFVPEHPNPKREEYITISKGLPLFFLGAKANQVCPCWHTSFNMEEHWQQIPVCRLRSWWTYATLSREHLENLPEARWKFLYFVRNPRNQIASLWKRHEMANDPLLKNPHPLFEHYCDMVRERAEVTVEVCEKLNGKIFYFEHFMNDKPTFIKDVFRFLGLKPSRELLQHIATSQRFNKENPSVVLHSSFNNLSGVNSRWEGYWTDWQQEMFQRVAGEATHKLGYV
jgi:hypothetical protein